MQIDLTGRRALVTGAGAGIGAGIAVALAKAGADVVVHYAHSAAGAADVVETITQLGRRAKSSQANLTVASEAIALVADAAEFLGGLDILVNNAGHLVGRATVEEMSDEHWEAVMGVNVTSAFYVTRSAISLLKASEYGRVVLMSSLASENGGGAGSVAYTASKAAVVGFARGLAKELAPSNVTVNAVAPGFIAETPFHDTFTPSSAQAGIIAGIPLGRAGTTDDVADVTLFLASDLSSYVTGQVVDINGGLNFR